MMTFILVQITLPPLTVEIFPLPTCYLFYPSMVHSFILKKSCPIVGYLFGSLGTLSQASDTRRNMSFWVPSSLGLINRCLGLSLSSICSDRCLDMTYLNGLVGHSGTHGCRVYCPTKGQHKPGMEQYFLAMMLPQHYMVKGCNPATISIHNIPPSLLMNIPETSHMLCNHSMILSSKHSIRRLV